MKKYASINDLPNELLIITFKLLYKMHWTRRMGLPFMAFTGKGYWQGDPFAPSMFPFAQAKVCRRWCALLAHYPTYWTRIPITADPTTTPLHNVANYFSWSQGLPVEVFVKSHPHTHNMQDFDEKSYVDAVLPYISQHLYHIKSIQISLLHQTSIPELPRWLVGQANILESIHLYHERHRGTALYDHDSNPQDGGNQLELQFSAPKLTSLSIDWHTFAQACRTNRTWFTNTPELRYFDLAPSRPRSPVEHLSIRTTIEALSHVGHGFGSISVRGIHFAEDHALFEPPSFGIGSSMTFEDLRGTSVAAFVRAGGAILDCLSIKNCSLLNLNDFFAYALILEDLNEDCSLAGPFSNLAAFDISLHKCPAFNDTILDFMADGGLTGEDFPARGIGSLTLKQCTNFSVECLYRMVLARRTAMEASTAWDGTVEGLAPGDTDELSAIVSLDVTGGPFLSGEYREKFQQLVPQFAWLNASVAM